MFIQIEETPNPDALKFLPGIDIMPTGSSANFTRNSDLTENPLVLSLFEIEEVQGVMFGEDFISITKTKESSWSSLKADILTIIMDHCASGDFLNANSIESSEEIEEFYDEEDKEKVEEIKSLLENYVKPAVAQDGGSIAFRGYRKGVVYVRLKGACSGCPSSSVTLKEGILNMLSYYLPDIVDVVGDDACLQDV